MKLYEIDEAIMNCFDTETGELLDAQKLDELEMVRTDKIEGVCLAIKNLDAEEKALKEEADKFTARAKTAKAQKEGYKAWLKEVLEGTPFKTTKVAVSFRSTESVQINDDAVIPNEYMRIKVEPDKTALKDAIKHGIEVKGVYLKTDKAMTIK